MAEDDDDLEQQSGLRGFWSGTISFGLVTVPVALYAATRSRGVGLKMIGLSAGHELSGGAKIDWQEDGLALTLEFPVPEIVKGKGR